MTLLIANRAQDEIHCVEIGGSRPVKMVIDTLTSIDAGSFNQDPRVRLVGQAEGHIRVLKIVDLRICFTRLGNDLVFLNNADT